MTCTRADSKSPPAPPKSPAREAGIEAGDVIIEVNKVAMHSQAQLKHALGPLYAGDIVDLVLLRDGQRATNCK